MDQRHVDREIQMGRRISTNSHMLPLEDESAAEADEPPDEQSRYIHAPAPLRLPAPMHSGFEKSGFSTFQRRESLLTQALHSKESENEAPMMPSVNGTLSRSTTTSTWSNPSTASTAELTSDDGFNSPGLRTNSPSPPLPPVSTYSLDPLPAKQPEQLPPSAITLNSSNPIPDEPTEPAAERAVEAKLGRKRCIRFACGKKSSPGTSPTSKPLEEQPATRPERKCMLRFICTKRDDIQSHDPYTKRPDIQQPEQPTIRRPRTPTPALAVSPRRASARQHRESDATVKNESPKTARKVAAALARRKFEESEDLGHTSATRFHEFASSEEEVDDWVQESTCHRSRLTVNDTFGKENVIRQLGKDAEEEDEGFDDEEILDADQRDVDDEDDDDNDDDEEADEDDAPEVKDDYFGGGLTVRVAPVSAKEHAHVSDDGFQTDDENGFANTDDDESDTGSDYRWWQPGRSTAATSMEHLEHLRPGPNRTASDSSIGSVASGHLRFRSPHPKKLRRTSHQKSRPLDIQHAANDLPDSTDFVCGTLDEDRPLEQAYMSCLEQRKAAKHKVVPQDIDPSFPTSDLEMDEEDEVDETKHAVVDDSDIFLHGDPEVNETDDRGRTVSEWRRMSSSKKQPSPPKRVTTRSPPPMSNAAVHRSPPPPKRNIARSPPPRKLFGQSPRHLRSPPIRRLRSPPPSRHASFDKTTQPPKIDTSHLCLAQRPQLIHTASLPQTPGQAAKNLGAYDDDDSDDDAPQPATRSRGAIDIVKGLEKKRQLRKEKLYQKYCNRAGKDKEKKPKPGKGCERMRELGLELQAYRGKRADSQQDPHMLSL
ncbi:MAG: hypothetical protein M1820_007296 [Bogoriella megaspora]|nr:MAG: hypothetical protein M1820_007296 [Bogoriella megaspora]